jgi:hypothetical protein
LGSYFEYSPLWASSAVLEETWGVLELDSSQNVFFGAYFKRFWGKYPVYLFEFWMLVTEAMTIILSDDE